MSRGRSLPDGFTAWPRDNESPFGRAGFSFRRGDLRGELQPYRDRNTSAPLTRWEGILWRGTEREDILARVTSDNHWDAGAALAAVAERHA